MFLLRGFKRSIQSPALPLVKQNLKTPGTEGNPAWELAWRAIIAFEANPAKVDGLPTSWSDYAPESRRRAQRFYYGYLRWREALRPKLELWLRKWPRPSLGAALLLGAVEILQSAPDRRPAVVHAVVAIVKKRLSLGEAKLVNAVLRKLVLAFQDGWNPSAESAHPAWLAARWETPWGAETASALMAWNQTEPQVFAVWEGPGDPPSQWRESEFPGYWTIEGADAWTATRPLLALRQAYVQDPFARHPVELLAPQEGEWILDACAAPGGKTRGILRLAPTARVVAADLPGARLERLQENLQGTSAVVLGKDLLALSEADLVSVGAPTTFDGILLDVPCSNTGVIARRPDVRHLLSPAQLESLPPLQLALLGTVAARVRPGGRLVYSTCSLEPEENEVVVQQFLAENPEFALTAQRMSRPWVDHHDGGGAFLLTRLRGEK
jgi:16S rRNA (cytosine967-C5)-methyltransferase